MCSIKKGYPVAYDLLTEKHLFRTANIICQCNVNVKLSQADSIAHKYFPWAESFERSAVEYTLSKEPWVVRCPKW